MVLTVRYHQRSTTDKKYTVPGRIAQLDPSHQTFICLNKCYHEIIGHVLSCNKVLFSNKQKRWPINNYKSKNVISSVSRTPLPPSPLSFSNIPKVNCKMQNNTEHKIWNKTSLQQSLTNETKLCRILSKIKE